jgi:hypothetical protein
MLYEVNIQHPRDGVVDVFAELKSGTTFIGCIPQSDLIPIGDVRAFMRVIVLEDDDDLGGFVLVEPCYDARWRLEPDCEELLVYAVDLAPELPPGILPHQRQGHLANI